MNKVWQQKLQRIDWEQHGYKTMLECADEKEAIEICSHELQSLQAEMDPVIGGLRKQADTNRHHGDALHEHLYGRAIPVNDASMLTHRSKVRTVLVLAVLALATSFASNLIMFLLLGWGALWSGLAAAAITAVPLGLGHLAYERFLAENKSLQGIVIALIAILLSAGVYEFGQSRRVVADQAAAQSADTSYVDGGASDPSTEPEKHENNESRFHESFGESLFLISLAAELGAGFLIGMFVKLRTDEDYAAWKALSNIHDLIWALEKRTAEVLSLVEIAKKQCTVGIRRAQSSRRKRKPPYYKGLLIITLIAALYAGPIAQAQTAERYEGILIDTSTSISRDGHLFKEYMGATRELLATEPAESHVWILAITRDSFGGPDEILVGRTPVVHGIFTNDLDRAREQLIRNFDARSASLKPVASATDIFGGLWHLKAFFESSHGSRIPAPTVWILSDMVNETRNFPMPQLLKIGPERMLERAKIAGLVVPLPRYKVHVLGATPAGLTPQAWMTLKRFWYMYFRAAGAEVETYSVGCTLNR